MGIDFGSLRINMGDFIVKRYGKFNQRGHHIFFTDPDHVIGIYPLVMTNIAIENDNS